YKHFTEEGGIATPFIVHWPAGIKKPGVTSRQIGHITDLMATFVDIAGAQHPETFNGHDIQPLEGESLRPILEGKTRTRGPIFWEHEGNRAVRVNQWKLVARHHRAWELYD